MTFTTFVSVPLLALVASSLPILPDSELMSAEMQDSAQVVFRLRSSHPDDFHCDAQTEIGTTYAAANDGYLSFDAVHGSTTAEGLMPFGQRITTVISSGDEVPTTHNLSDLVTNYGKADFLTSASILFLIFSCTIVLLTLACVGLRLYAIKHLHTQILWSHKAWQSLPHVENHAVLSSCRRNSDIGTTIALTQSILDEKSEEPPYFSARASAPLSCVSIATSDDLGEDPEDEKFHDALDILPSLGVQDPSPDSPSQDLSLLPIPTALDPTPDDRPIPSQACVHPTIDSETREPPTRPSWSMRVARSIPAPPSSPLIHPRSRAYRAVPEFDIALAMQLRPGRGVGADPAWMVRFLMAIFGWFAVALTGNQ
ncbi:uncharacterized protein EDB93DRAFT_1187727 [Suillus bovinus]|uniref:uncharacterized protein n=1 Tax=Suillus bovinus TaxID=48563 RepID=UPI001B86D560|nr:uncharacterized protein EDB93DRAFT_1187727 [Suillus bovinus]KAG2126876.1 hypothetical protein EDB93DRAFT_1187727 [Suillus bovinus]